MQLSLVIPMFNEAESAPELVGEIAAVLDGKLDYELVITDDGSTDPTFEVLSAMRSDFPCLRLVRHGRNAGQSAAILSGVRAARSAWIMTLDGDGQNDPADIAALYALAAERDDSDAPLMVAGVRRKRNDHWVRRLSSRVANGIRQRLLHDECPDTGCGLKLFPRETFLRLPHFDHFHRFMPALFRRAGVPVINVPVNHRPRMRGRSKYGVGNRLWVGIVDLLGVMWLQRRVVDPASVSMSRGCGSVRTQVSTEAVGGPAEAER